MKSTPRIELVPVSALVVYERNARTHSVEQVSQIAVSIREFGWTNPILVDEANNIIAGHGRFAAAVELGLAEVPCIRLEGLTDAQKRALRIADNKLALNAGWDDALLALELGDLQGLGFDLALTGFGDIELGALFAKQTPGLTDPDEVPEPPAEPVSQRGDLWQLGRHWLLCGDATNADDVAKVLGGVQPHLMVTDPPYGVSYRAAWREEAFGAGNRSIGLVANDDRADWRAAWALFPGDVVYCWTSGRFVPESILALESIGFQRRCLIVWSKSRFVVGRGHYHSQEEECWYAVREGATGHWQGDRTQSTLWQIDPHHKSETGHSTQKPVESMRRPIENNSAPGQAIYDPFVGSGTTIIAAEMTGRTCHAIEIDPTYVDVAITRWQNFTGCKAERRTREQDKPSEAHADCRTAQAS